MTFSKSLVLLANRLTSGPGPPCSLNIRFTRSFGSFLALRSLLRAPDGPPSHRGGHSAITRGVP